MMDEKLLERIGVLKDKADDYLALALSDGMPAIVLLDAFEQGLKEIAEELRNIYLDAGGEDVWKAFDNSAK